MPFGKVPGMNNRLFVYGRLIGGYTLHADRSKLHRLGFGPCNRWIFDLIAGPRQLSIPIKSDRRRGDALAVSSLR